MQGSRVHALIVAVATAVALGTGAPSALADLPGCAPSQSPGGEWRSYGHDYSNTRTQDREKEISTANAALLSPAWAFSTIKAGGVGDITGTPIVADGCVYTATTRGWVFALNADSGQLVWKAKVPYGGYVTSSPGVAKRVCGTKKVRVRSKKRRRGKRRWKIKRVAVHCPTVYLDVSRPRKARGCRQGDPCIGPYVTAFDQRDGRLAFATNTLDEQSGSDTFGSPVILDGVLMLGISGGSAEVGDEADRYAFQGSMVFLDSSTGRILRKTWIIHPPAQPEDEFAGAGIWTTPAVDPEAKVAYAGVGNPYKPEAEHPYANSVLKFDVNRRSPRFGQIVGHYKGTIDEYVPGMADTPCIDFPGNLPPHYPQGLGECADLDLDFGASPNLFRGPDGRRLVGDGQKSGVYHVFDAQTMKREWTQVVGPPSAVGGIVGSTAHDGKSVFGPITVPGYLWSLGAEHGDFRWVAPIADGAHYGESVSVANGAVYSVDTHGFLDVFDAETGRQVAKRPLTLGGSAPESFSWGGVSIARNTVYAAVGMLALEEGWIVAFRPGDAGDLAEDAGQSATRPPDDRTDRETPAGVPIIATPGSTYTTYATPAMVTHEGGAVTFINLDLQQHDVVSEEKGPDGEPLFSSPLLGTGQYDIVDGVEKLKAGSSYGFYCSIHPGMRGTLTVR